MYDACPKSNYVILITEFVYVKMFGKYAIKIYVLSLFISTGIHFLSSLP